MTRSRKPQRIAKHSPPVEPDLATNYLDSSSIALLSSEVGYSMLPSSSPQRPQSMVQSHAQFYLSQNNTNFLNFNSNSSNGWYNSAGHSASDESEPPSAEPFYQTVTTIPDRERREKLVPVSELFLSPDLRTVPETASTKDSPPAESAGNSPSSSWQEQLAQFAETANTLQEAAAKKQQPDPTPSTQYGPQTSPQAPTSSNARHYNHVLLPHPHILFPSQPSSSNASNPLSMHMQSVVMQTASANQDQLPLMAHPLPPGPSLAPARAPQYTYPSEERPDITPESSFHDSQFSPASHYLEQLPPSEVNLAENAYPAFYGVNLFHKTGVSLFGSDNLKFHPQYGVCYERAFPPQEVEPVPVFMDTDSERAEVTHEYQEYLEMPLSYQALATMRGNPRRSGSRGRLRKLKKPRYAQDGARGEFFKIDFR